MFDSEVEGIILAAVGMFCWAVQIVIIRRTRAEAHWLQIEFLTACLQLVLTPSVWLIQYVVVTIEQKSTKEVVNLHIEPFQWGDSVLVGVFSLIGLGCCTRGFQLEEAPRGAILMYLEIPLIYFLQWIVFGRGVSWTELSGIVLVLLGSVGTAAEKVFADKRERMKTVNAVLEREASGAFYPDSCLVMCDCCACS